MNLSSKFFAMVTTCLAISGGVALADEHDMARVAPHNTKVLFENDRVRVLETRIKPGEKLPMHSHPPRVNYFLNPLKERITYQEKGPQVFSWKAGEAAYFDAMTLQVENIGTTEGRNIVVELKGNH